MSDRAPALVLLLIATAAVGLLLLNEPVFKPYRQMEDDIEEARSTVVRLRRELRARQNTGSDRARVWTEYGPPLSPQGRLARATRFYSWIEDLALGSGLAVASTQPRAEEIDETGVVRLPVQVTLDGDLKGLVGFLAQLRSTPSLVGIDRLVIRRRERADRPLNVQALLVAYGVVDQATRDALAREREKRNRRKR